jgi:hypothetical protein
MVAATFEQRPGLVEIPLSSVWPPKPGRSRCFVTAVHDQPWDNLLEGAMLAAFILLVLNDEEVPIKAFTLPGAARYVATQR